MIKVHLYRVWPDVMGSRPGLSLLEWGRMRFKQQQDEIPPEEVMLWKTNQEERKAEDNNNYA